jgi:hypothetical protein
MKSPPWILTLGGDHMHRLIAGGGGHGCRPRNRAPAGLHGLCICPAEPRIPAAGPVARPGQGLQGPAATSPELPSTPERGGAVRQVVHLVIRQELVRAPPEGSGPPSPAR